MSTVTSSPRGQQAEVWQFFWRNYLAHIIEGGLFMGGMTFLAANSVMPAMVKSLGGSSWVISVMPVAMGLGFMGPALLIAHRVERLYAVKPLVMLTGIFQRLPFLVAALALFFAAESHPALVLVLVAAAPLVSGLCGGVSSSAWFELVARTVPPERRASAWAIRNVIAAALGMAAGGVIAAVLAKHPGPTGYGVLHLIAFAFLLVSYLVFALVRETSAPPKREKDSPRRLTDNLRSLHGLVREDRQLRGVLLARVFACGIFVMAPFMSIHALEVTGQPESFLGYLVAAQMVGGILGNIAAGYAGDRWGGKALILLAAGLLVVTCVLAALARVPWNFLVVFFLFGLGFAFNRVGGATLGIEICPIERRPTYMALWMFVGAAGMLVAAGLSTAVRELSGRFLPAAIISAACMALALYFTARLREPRALRPKAEGGEDPRPVR
jgi:MFS family permease